jgi:predicted Rossmann fold flavoprotein
MSRNIAVVGGGAAGFFAAIWAKTNHPNARVVILEKTDKILAKVRISGGGRCNVTNGTTSIKELTQGYPRGGKMLKKLFPEFSTKQTIEWFEKRGVPLYIQSDNRVFPKTDSSQTIINCLLEECQKLGIEIKLRCGVNSILPKKDGLELQHGDGSCTFYTAVIIATGGSPKESGLEWLRVLGHKIEPTVPSLFTFNMPDEPIQSLMGVSVEHAIVSIQGTTLKAEGPLLITHWGMSGPAVLKISSIGARLLADFNYRFVAQINWVGEKDFGKIQSHLKRVSIENPKKYISNTRLFGLPSRLWLFLIDQSGIKSDASWESLGKSQFNKLTEILCNDLYKVVGKTTFKEEFVTCGGVSLSSINKGTMQSLHIPNLYFAGEVLDIDGITGGYNFQAAWTTAYFAGKLA